MTRYCEERFPAINRYRKVGGVIDFSPFEEFDGDLSNQRNCILEHFSVLGVAPAPEDVGFLEELTPAQCSEAAFLGEWYDPDRRKLLARGTWRTTAGDLVESPTIEERSRFKIRAGSFGIPAAGGRGQFAYAFYSTPYGLRGSGAYLQELFNDVWTMVSPPDCECEYYDWSSPELDKHFKPYFDAGAEWWGTFLFTIQNPSAHRLWVMSASTTD